MKNLFKIPKNQTHHYVLVLILVLFVVFPISIPHELASLVSSLFGKVVIVVVVLNLFLLHPVIGSVGVVAAYELVRRSSETKGSGADAIKKFIPSEQSKKANLTKYNQFPLTVEEIVIKSKIPYSFNLSNPSDSSPFLPIQEDIHEASSIENM
jgi:hypothetical protein